MNLSQFIAKHNAVKLTECFTAQQHFLDLCEILNHPRPVAADSTGDSFAFRDMRFNSMSYVGFGLDFERLMLYLTGMKNIRDAIPCPTPGSAGF